MKTIPSFPQYKIDPNGEITKGNRVIKNQSYGCVRATVEKKLRLVSELIAETYLDFKFDSDLKVIFKDGNCLNVTLDNLLVVDKAYSQLNIPSIMFDGEEYRQITFLETNQYYVSATGKVLNFATKKLLKPQHDTPGYLRMTYYYFIDGKRYKKTIAVHILVYQVFNGAYDREALEINHIDGNKENNNLDNLEAVTHTINVKHAVQIGLKSVKYSEKDIGSIIKLLDAGITWDKIWSDYLAPVLGLRKIQAYSLINHIKNSDTGYQDKCANHGFVKGSTTRT